MLTESDDELEALLARVEAATGADREMDALICVAFADVPEPPGVFKLGACPPRIRLHDDWRVDCVGANGVVRSHTPKAYTASLDAAIALCERCEYDTELCLCAAITTLMGTPFTVDRLARAVLAAILRAKIAAMQRVLQKARLTAPLGYPILGSKEDEMKNLYTQALTQIEGSLVAAANDCRDASRDGGEINANTLHGALFHAKEAIGRLERLIAAVESFERIIGDRDDFHADD